jgi:hypothetical protein
VDAARWVEQEGKANLGYLLYSTSSAQISFDDHTLAHLQIVMMSKLRRGESFFFSWRDDPALGDGRSSIWISSSIPLMFHFSEPGRAEINREWLELLTHSANSGQGLYLVDEPGQETPRPWSSLLTGQQPQQK